MREFRRVTLAESAMADPVASADGSPDRGASAMRALASAAHIASWPRAGSPPALNETVKIAGAKEIPPPLDGVGRGERFVPLRPLPPAPSLKGRGSPSLARPGVAPRWPKAREADPAPVRRIDLSGLTAVPPLHHPTVTGAGASRPGDHVGGGMLPPPVNTVALSDGTRISFGTVGDVAVLEDA
jgi:hypothetical protein